MSARLRPIGRTAEPRSPKSSSADLVEAARTWRTFPSRLDDYHFRSALQEADGANRQESWMEVIPGTFFTADTLFTVPLSRNKTEQIENYGATQPNSTVSQIS